MSYSYTIISDLAGFSVWRTGLGGQYWHFNVDAGDWVYRPRLSPVGGHVSLKTESLEEVLEFLSTWGKSYTYQGLLRTL